VVAKAIVSIFAKSATVDITSNGEVFASLDVCGSGVSFGGCGGTTIYRLNSSSTGKTLGTTCTDLTFDDAAPSKFDPPLSPPPPFSGTWQWPETKLDEWFLNSSFEFRNVGGPADFELQCLKVTFVTKAP
jgi:hypothetical protein